MKIPILKHYINDFSGVLENDSFTKSNASAKEFDTKTSTQAVTVIFPHRQGRELRDIALEVFNENGIGQKGKNNGLLLIISSDEKKIRIMVGKGLEWIYDTLWCRNIIENKLRPLLIQGEYSQLIQVWHSEIQAQSASPIPKYTRQLNAKLTASIFISFFTLPMIGFISMLLIPKVALFLYLLFIFICGILIYKKIISHTARSILIVIICISVLSVFPFLVKGLYDIKQKEFCEANPIVCEERKREKERKFCEAKPSLCVENRIQYDSQEYKDYIESQSSSSNSSGNSSSWGGSSSSFGGGGGSSNGAGFGD